MPGCGVSYIRGKAATGDVDMLVLAPPSCGDVDPAQLLHDLVTALTDEVDSHTHDYLTRYVQGVYKVLGRDKTHHRCVWYALQLQDNEGTSIVFARMAWQSLPARACSQAEPSEPVTSSSPVGTWSSVRVSIQYASNTGAKVQLKGRCARSAHAQGLLLRDVVVSEPAARGGGGSAGGHTRAATFLGVCRHAISPCVRRFDIKIYPRR